MRLFITGYSGQLGYDVAKEAEKRGYEYRGVSSKDLDITDETAANKQICEYAPDVVIHCAAYTKVDQAEDDIENCRRINVDGTANIAKVCEKLDCPMVYISTDYIFDGQGTEAWLPDDKNFAPINVYGQSKLDGEFEVVNRLSKFFVVRISWVFGLNGNNFIKTMLKVSETHDKLRVVNDQIGLPTYTKDLSKLLVDMIETDKYGIYHATNKGDYISWYDFACEIFKQSGRNIEVTPVTTEEYGLSKARRPYNSRLDTTKLSENGFDQLPEWKDALHRYLQEIAVI